MSVSVLPKEHKFYGDLVKIRKYCITKSPGFAGIALLPNYHIINPKDKLGKEYGFTDGNSIWVGTRLFKESPKVQAFVIIHEVLHVALRHPQRAVALRKARISRGQTWSSKVFNWAADAIVNFSLENASSWVHRPSFGLIEFSNLLKPEVLNVKPPHRWTVESLFTHLMDEVVSPAIAAEGYGSADAWGEQNLPRNGTGMLDIELPESFKGKDAIKEDSREDSRNWENRIKRAAAGDSAGGVMKEILFDVPYTKTPWRHLLRRLINDAVMPQTQEQPTRPSRHTIVLDAFYKETCRDCVTPFFPAHRPAPGIKKIVVVVDTSGSIDDEICEYFAGEIQSIRKKVGCDLTLITCDAEVHQTININAYDSLHKCIKKSGGFKGRGGTDFRPGIKAAEKIKGAAVIIYLTDMMGPYPDTCSIPLLWASISEEFQKPPVGKVIVLNKDN